jgi:hypothetical protein
MAPEPVLLQTKGFERGERIFLSEMNFAPTSTSAREAHAAGELADWSQAFLRGEGGNLGVANPLRDRDDDVYVLAEVTLGDVYPISGPRRTPIGPCRLSSLSAGSRR